MKIIDITKELNAKKILKPSKRDEMVDALSYILKNIDGDFHIIVDADSVRKLADGEKYIKKDEKNMILTSNMQTVDKKFPGASYNSIYVDLNEVIQDGK